MSSFHSLILFLGQLIQDSINNTVESHRNMEFLRHQRAYDNSRPTIPAIENIQGCKYII